MLRASHDHARHRACRHPRRGARRSVLGFLAPAVALLGLAACSHDPDPPAGSNATSAATPKVTEDRERTRAERGSVVGPDGAGNLATSEQRRDEWRQRVEKYRAALRAIQNDPTLDDAGRRAAMEKLVAEANTGEHAHAPPPANGPATPDTQRSEPGKGDYNP